MGLVGSECNLIWRNFCSLHFSSNIFTLVGTENGLVAIIIIIIIIIYACFNI